MNGVSLERFGSIVVLAVCLAGGCNPRMSPSPERYVGTWAGPEDQLRIDRNGLGEGRVIRGRDARPFTWELGVDRITITFDGSNRPEIFEGRLDAEGRLVVSSRRTSVKLARVAAPDPRL